MMKNGQEESATFELTHAEKHFVAHTHERHMGCEIAKCNFHHMVHLIIRLEAGRRKLEHELEHGEVGSCERCKWKDVDWLTNQAAEWRNP